MADNHKLIDRKTRSLNSGRSRSLSATLRRHRNSLENSQVRSWLREREPDAISSRELVSQLSRPDNGETIRNPPVEKDRKSEPDDDFFDMFDRMEEKNPGIFDELLEQLTKWGMKRVVDNIKKDLQADPGESRGMKDKEGGPLPPENNDEKNASHKIKRRTLSTDGDDNLVVSVPGHGNTVHLHLNDARKPTTPAEEPDNLKEESTRPEGERTFEELEDDPSIDKQMKKAAVKKLKGRERGSHVLERLSKADGISEILLSIKGKNRILHRRVFLNHDGYSMTKGGQKYLCIGNLIKSICMAPSSEPTPAAIEKSEIESMETKLPPQKVSVPERTMSRDNFKTL